MRVIGAGAIGRWLPDTFAPATLTHGRGRARANGLDQFIGIVERSNPAG